MDTHTQMVWGVRPVRKYKEDFSANTVYNGCSQQNVTDNGNLQVKQIRNATWHKYEWKQIDKSCCSEKWPNWRKGVRGLQWQSEWMNFFCGGQNHYFTHRGFQIYPILAGQKFCWLRKWPPKLKSLFFRGSFTRLTFWSQAGTLSTFWLAGWAGWWQWW